jgi:hypothetical protein
MINNKRKLHFNSATLFIFEIMSRNYKFHNPEGVYFVSFAVVEWLDACLPSGRFSPEMNTKIF